MLIMKTRFKFIFGIVCLVGLSSCANGKLLENANPESFGQAYYTTWTAGVRGADSGIVLYLPADLAEMKEMEPDSAFFRGEMTKLIADPQNHNLLTAYFTSRKSSDHPELIMSSDPREEYGNKPPMIEKEIPFELEDDEAIVSFKKDGKIVYFRLSGIFKKEDPVK